MNKRFLPLLALLALAPRGALAQGTAPAAPAATATAADSAAIRAAALDYIQGWYTGDAARMQRAVHPELSKRVMIRDPRGETWLSNSSADALVHSTRLGFGKDTPPDRQRADLQILAIDGDMATARLISAKLIDYMHLVRWNGEWKIVNVLWDYQPGARPTPRP